MELYQTEKHYIVQDGTHSLWCDRSTGQLVPKRGDDLCSAWNPICIGVVYGIIGNLKLHPGSEWKLLLIRQRKQVARIANHTIYQITKIAVLPLSNQEPVDLELELCSKHHFGIRKPERITQPDSNQKALQKTWNSIKSAAETVKPKKKEIKDKEKFEKRILEELMKMYNESDSFYYSETFDITNSIDRQHADTYDKSLPLWKRADGRFFWNQHMLLELIEAQVDLADHWIVPIIQGFVQMEMCKMDFEENRRHSPSDPARTEFHNSKLKDALEYGFCLLSRRSRHRAGTRAKYRGIDDFGAVANYVETEQIIEFAPHIVAFVQVRGSIPVYWSQTGFKYRPPPRLDRDEEASHRAFVKHIEEQLSLYKDVVVISLADQTGKERPLGDAFLSHVFRLNSPHLTYVAFDFHDHCRGMKFENVSLLTDEIRDLVKDMRYSWVDNRGTICEQRGVFRVNCIDCLDRTNVVQTAVARIIMETQFRKLGLLPPEENLPPSCRIAYQKLWANNGDAISRQYAGTAALKGDFTRTGERKLTGMMKDGVNSASRYYLRFKDTYRQAMIDLTLGQPVSEEVLSLSTSSSRAGSEEDSNELLEKEENLKMLIEDCKKMLIVEPEQCLGGWGLINADPSEGDSDRQEMDTILLLSQRAVYVAWYDDEEEQVTRYQRIFLEDIEKVEIGLEQALFKSRFVCLRIHYHNLADTGFFHTLRVPNHRLFNNMVIAVKNQDEAKESLRAIVQSFQAAQEILSLELEVVERTKLDRKRTLPHPEVVDVHKQQQENSLAGIHLPRDVSADILPSEDSASPAVREDNDHVDKNPLSLRPRSPMDFIPAALRAPFSKPSLPGLSGISLSSRLTLPQGGLRASLEGATSRFQGATSRLTRAFYAPHKADGVDANNSRDEEDIRRCSQDSLEEVVLDSCGILATNPVQVIVTSQRLGERPLSLTEEAESGAAPPGSAVGGQASRGDREVDGRGRNLSGASTGEGHTSRGLDQAASAGEGEENRGFQMDGVCQDQADGKEGEERGNSSHNDDGKAQHDFSHDLIDLSSPRDGKNAPVFISEVGSPEAQGENDVRAGRATGENSLQGKPDKPARLPSKTLLTHPVMKVSLSDSQLLLPAGEAGEGRAAPLAPLAAPGDSSPFSKLKMGLAGVSLPVVSSATPISRSQRFLEFVATLKKEKLGEDDCHTKVIFI